MTENKWTWEQLEDFRKLSAEDRLKKTFFLVEATSFEQHVFWERWAKESKRCIKPLVQEWQQANGYLVQVGRYNGQPNCISMVWDILDGRAVCFWHDTSAIVNHTQIEEWLAKHFEGKTKDGRPATCNADNFHHLMGELAP